jgi:hypothetical protein
LWWFDDDAVPTVSSDSSFAWPPFPALLGSELGFEFELELVRFAVGNLGGFSGEGAKSENVPVERLLK